MAEIPRALVKDLLSTGYFYEELKNYSESNEIDLASFSRNFAVPHLAKKVEIYQNLGQTNRSGILNLAVKCLSKANDEEMAASILELKKVAASEMDTNEKALFMDVHFDKSELLSFRQKSETAESLGKLLVVIIRMFKLPEALGKRDRSDEVSASIANSIKAHWELPVFQGK
jgi:hypothetical protein